MTMDSPSLGKSSKVPQLGQNKSEPGFERKVFLSVLLNLHLETRNEGLTYLVRRHLVATE